ncbi:GGDEF domain-containing protein [Lysinibacillus sp. KCTC 33748]|uniref:sensor domain-containing diguanylate cyclase n=1 Tax=unclassified Lysinibacillus TaxID=2636778 RepID=UPI0009A69710|nr:MULTISPECIES: sensor domain-containing diguanylate cyclase [unclassified Lysinibacillus]OXS73732.1 GGDEF domain-containing protein [Lysinibacillus sp. KCTC 33748]SKB75130.1 diguanylate cyclase with GAF sensor [Lysinibacillus sp. AC-3]
MTDHLQTLKYIKSDVLSIWVSSKEQTGLNEYFHPLEQCLKKHFGIVNVAFLGFEGNSLIPVEEMATLTIETKLNAVSWLMIEASFYQQKMVKIPYILKEKEAYSKMTDMVLFQVEGRNPIGGLLVEATDAWTDFMTSNYGEESIETLTKVLQLIRENYEVKVNEDQFRKLYNMTDLFHSTMDIDLILENVLKNIKDNFPEFNVELILSNDQDRHTTIDIKLFDYLSERPATIEAFVSGELTTELASDLNCRVLNAPIKGRQAIYGILQVSAPTTYLFSTTEKDFVRMLAQTSGNALENAKLYHQSHRLVSDLQLINETSHRLNMRIGINEMLLFLQKQLMKSFQPMEVCFAFKHNDTFEVTDASTALFNTEKGQTFIKHVEQHFKSTNDPLFIADFSRLTPTHIEYRSIMAIPILMEEKINGFSIVLHKEPYFFSFDSFKLMQSLIHHSSLAIANSILRHQLQEMVDLDHLTKLYARSYLDKYVEKSLINDQSGMFLLIDIDNFKRVNDTYGHQIGDKILMQIAVQLKEMIGARGICARWGGEEMSVYVPNIDEKEAIELAEEIVAVIPNTTDPRVTISAGLITWDELYRPPFQSVFLHADTALYEAKNSGKNRFCMHDRPYQIN